MAPTPAGLKEALRYGLTTAVREGFRAATGQALLGLHDAPFGLAHLAPAPDAPSFDPQPVGTAGSPRAIEFHSDDRRSLRVAAVRLGGEDAGEFRLRADGCGAAMLARGESCGVEVAFSPQAAAAGERSAVLELVLEGIDAPVAVPLSATATAPPPQPDPPGEPAQPVGPALPAGPRPAGPLAPDAVLPLTATQGVGESREAEIATLTCPAAAVSCTVKVPRRVRLLVAGRYYGARVLAPPTLAGGESAALRVRLARRAFAQLGGDGATVKVRVWLLSEAGAAFRLVEARIEGA